MSGESQLGCTKPLMNTGTNPFFVNTKLPGNTADKTTLRPFLEQIERQYGKTRCVWLMDRGVPTEEVLAEMHDCAVLE